MTENRELIVEEIKRNLEYLEKLDSTSPKYTTAVDNTVKLYDLVTECDKKKDDRKDQKFHRMIEYGLEASSIVLPLIFYGRWMKRGFKFEETGSFTSTTFRGLFQKFKPTKI